MAFLFVLGTLVGILSPVFRRDTRLRAVILASGAAIVSVVAAGYLLHQDPRDGLATIRANQQFGRIVLASGLPTVVLALFSLRRAKLYWLAWGIHVAFSAWITAVLIWLKFFWHW
jgi:hypothetical protein